MNQRIRKLLLLSIIILSWFGTTNICNAQTSVSLITNDTEPVAIKKWLVAGTFQSENIAVRSGKDPFRKGYSTDFLKSIGGESNAKIKSGSVIKTKDGEKVEFKSFQWKDDYLDLDEVYGAQSNVSAYLYTELESEVAQTVVLDLGTNDAGKLWVNGKLVSYFSGNRAAYPSQNTSKISLEPGKRVSILIKIDQGGGGWGAFFEVYGLSAHQKFMDARTPKTFDISSNSQNLVVGDTLKAYVVQYPTNNFAELDVPIKWELEDRGVLASLEGNSDEINFVIPEGAAGQLILHGTKKIGNKKIKGELRFLVRQKEIEVFTEGDNAIDIGSQRELFVDHYLIRKLVDAELVLHEPKDEGEVLRFDKAWEGPFCAYVTIIKDGESYKAFYRGAPNTGKDGNSGEITCYAESKDGIHWEKPKVGIYNIMGTEDNNVILANDAPFSHNFSPFLDTKPNISSNEKYKAIAGVHDTGLFGFISEDGIHWKKIGDSPIFTKGIFDSQNVVFWSVSEKLYVCYFRTWSGPEFTGFRTISRTTSKDFTHWSEPERMDFGYTALEHLYTNQTHAYFRAPQIYISIAARFMPNRQVITAEQADALNVNPSYFNDCSDVIFMTSRGGNKYDRTFTQAFIRPGIGLENWVSRSNYPALNVVQTGKDEMSIYVQQNYAQPTAHLNRYSLRLDGFSSLKGSNVGGEMITKLLTFDGKQLSINFATSAAGEIAVEIQDKTGNAIPGFSIDECQILIGNEIDRVVNWKNGTDISLLAGKEIRLRFKLKDADLYSIKFE